MSVGNGFKKKKRPIKKRVPKFMNKTEVKKSLKKKEKKGRKTFCVLRKKKRKDRKKEKGEERKKRNDDLARSSESVFCPTDGGIPRTVHRPPATLSPTRDTDTANGESSARPPVHPPIRPIFCVTQIQIQNTNSNPMTMTMTKSPDRSGSRTSMFPPPVNRRPSGLRLVSSRLVSSHP